MFKPNEETIETFTSITGVSEAVAIKKLEENNGNLNAAVNAHYTEGDRNIAPETAFVSAHDDVMDVDDPIPVFPRELDPLPLPASRSPFVSHPREVREVPVEFKDGVEESGQSGNTPITEDITENARNHDPEIRGTVLLDDDDDPVHPGPSAPTIVDHAPDYSNDIEEEMIRAAIEASKHDTAMPNQDDHLETVDPDPRPVRSHLGDSELARAVLLSLQTAEKETTLRELGEGRVVDSELEARQPAFPQEMGKSTSSNGRQSQLEIGSSSIQDEADDVEEIELTRQRRRRVTTSSIDTPNDIEGVGVNPPSSPQPIENVHPLQDSGSDFPSDEWGGISSVEHDEAVMLEAAMFGGIPEGSSYHYPYTPRELMQNGLDRTMGTYPTSIPRPLSPSLTAQRLIREQQDDEFLASLQADREKELKAREEAEAALAEERRKEDEIRRQLLEEQEIERQLAAKVASLPQEPTPDDENAVTLLVRMPDGNRRGRRFRKSDMLQHLFYFIDVGRAVKPGSYRLVRPYPRRAFGVGESRSTLNELGLTSKHEALYLELI